MFEYLLVDFSFVEIFGWDIRLSFPFFLFISSIFVSFIPSVELITKEFSLFSCSSTHNLINFYYQNLLFLVYGNFDLYCHKNKKHTVEFIIHPINF